MNKHAQALGRKGKGKPKTMSVEAIEQRRAAAKISREKRLQKKLKKVLALRKRFRKLALMNTDSQKQTGEGNAPRKSWNRAEYDRLQQIKAKARAEIAPRTFAQCNQCGAAATLTTVESQSAWLASHRCEGNAPRARQLTCERCGNKTDGGAWIGFVYVGAECLDQDDLDTLNSLEGAQK